MNVKTFQRTFVPPYSTDNRSNSKDYDDECDDDDDIDKTYVCEHGKLFQLIYGHIMHRRWLLKGFFCYTHHVSFFIIFWNETFFFSWRIDHRSDVHIIILNLQGKRKVGIEIIQSITRYSETFSCQERNYERFVNALLTGGAGGFGQKQRQSLLTMPLQVMSATTARAK